MRRKLIAAGALGLGLATARVAAAHIVLTTPEAPAGSYYKAVFQVPHGCDGAATTALAVELPEGVVIAKPAPKPGWRLAIDREPLAQPVTNEGHRLTERPKLIRWEGGRLPDEEFDEFTMVVRLPSEPGRLYFPVIQHCGAAEVGWVQRPDPGSAARPPHPAPSVLLTRPGGG